MANVFPRAAWLTGLVIAAGAGIVVFMHLVKIDERYRAAFDRASAFGATNKSIGGAVIERWISLLEDNTPASLPQAVSIVQCFWEAGSRSTIDVDNDIRVLIQMRASTEREALQDAEGGAQKAESNPISENIWCSGMPEKLNIAAAQ